MINNTASDKVFISIVYLLLGIILVVVLYPLIYVLSASISNPIYVGTGEMWLWPRDITFAGYERVLRNMDIWTGFRNTLMYTGLGTTINLLLTIPCAYALSRKDLAGRNIIMGVLVFTMFFSGGLIPTYLIIKQLGMLNTIWSVVIGASVWNIIITRTYFQTTIPSELVEAAEIDGCSTFRLFLRIVLPLSAPIIAVMALFYGIGHWNSYFGAMIYLSDRELFPLQLILREILVINEMNDSAMMTGTEMETLNEQAKISGIMKYAVMVVSAAPVIVIYPFLQRYFVKGVMIGSLKG
ncbi:carbohydrate ABC transporter permease [Paenibacillus sp. GCM10027626]|uniref:carbohydrate ABC transporter permease n=1 Tax=Paenibacillus sp. GCM10027626 TaxID=3273411 RepID=UPI00362CB6F7